MQLQRGSNAVVVMGYIPCVDGIDISTRKVVTRLSDENPVRPGGIWYRLRKNSGRYEGFGNAEDHVVPIATDLRSGLPAVCPRNRLQPNEALRSIPAHLNVATYQVKASGVRLDSFIKKNQENTDMVKLAIARAAQSLAFMHAAGIAHTDPHVGNFIVNVGSGNRFGRVRLIDWGSALVKGKLTRSKLNALQTVMNQMPQAPTSLQNALEATPLDQTRHFNTLLRLDVAMFVRTLLIALPDNQGPLIGALERLSPLFARPSNPMAYVAFDMQTHDSNTVPTDVRVIERAMANVAPRSTRRELFPSQ